MRKVLMITVIAVALFMSLGATKCGKKKGGGTTAPESAIEKVLKSPVGSVILSREESQVTPKGARHYGKTAMSAAELAAVDKGIDDMIQAAREDGFKSTADTPHSFYEVFTPPYPCTLTPVQQLPGFLVNAGNQYDGTEFDQYNPQGRGVKDGRSVIYAAEMVLSVGTPGSNPQIGQMYNCPVTNPEPTRNGAEHIFISNFPYTAEFHETGRDGFTYANCSIYHGGSAEGAVNHPLLPRGGRCMSPTGGGSMLNVPPVVRETSVPDDIRQLAEEYGVELSNKDTMAIGLNIKPIR